ncbi:DUF4251 domain-containing protein [uncultured Bacteroides sp.]|uniref:DUF4251 domain-containing protein n=1 Tax=uncultured Bacteroides sp. TaxID=162156 RepID=UPI0025E746E5|nr:DUF4251 domain-containing protein [uncultured Bacteroides sp.]
MTAKLLKMTFVLFLTIGALQANAQETRENKLKEWKDSIEAVQKTVRAKHRMTDSLTHAKAVNALLNQNFVLESDELTLKHGEHGYVNSATNFIALHKGLATIQVSPFYSGGGPNGVGGITVEGRPSGLKVETDKKGITRLSMNVSGSGVSAQIVVILNPTDNRATASILPNFNSLNVTLEGRLLPFGESTVFKGSSL